MDQQLQLAAAAEKLKRQGINVIISNHDLPFIRNLYRNGRIVPFEVRRSISAKAKDRGKVGEVLAIF